MSTTEDRNRILSKEELNRFDRHVHHLETLLDVERKHFLDILVNGGCITERHKDRVRVQQARCDKNRELLSIIRRRSYADYVTFVDTLKKTKQRPVLQVLKQNSGKIAYRTKPRSHQLSSSDLIMFLIIQILIFKFE